MQLDASLSTSVNGQPLTYQWSLSPASLGAAIFNGNTPKATVQFAAGPGTYVVLLTVTDSAGATAIDTVTINYTGK